MVVCGPTTRVAAETDPCLVVEILSESTAAIDQIEKLAAYAAVPSVLAYLIVSQTEKKIIVHRRVGEDLRPERYGPGESLRLDCPSTELSIDEIYDDLGLLG